MDKAHFKWSSALHAITRLLVTSGTLKITFQGDTFELIRNLAQNSHFHRTLQI